MAIDTRPSSIYGLISSRPNKWRSPTHASLIYSALPHLCAGITYLDHAGTTVYSASQLQAHVEELQSTLYGNPHSQNPRSLATSEAVDFVRDLVLSHFGTDSSHYDVVFTSGCTGALRLLADVFPWLPVPAAEVGSCSDQLQREHCLFQHCHMQSQDGPVVSCECTGGGPQGTGYAHTSGTSRSSNTVALV